MSFLARLELNCSIIFPFLLPRQTCLLSDASKVVLHSPSQKLHDKGDDHLLIDNVVMVPLSDELVCKDPNCVVTDQCPPILGPSVDVVPDDQFQQSISRWAL